MLEENFFIPVLNQLCRKFHPRATTLAYMHSSLKSTFLFRLSPKVELNISPQHERKMANSRAHIFAFFLKCHQKWCISHVNHIFIINLRRSQRINLFVVANKICFLWRSNVDTREIGKIFTASYACVYL